MTTHRVDLRPCGCARPLRRQLRDLEGIVEHPRSISHATRRVFPGSRLREGEGVVPQHWRCGRESFCAAIRRRRPREGSGALIPGSMEDVRLRVISAARVRLNGAGPSAAKEALA